MSVVRRLAAVIAERDRLAGELEAARQDVEDAAGELLVSIPPPGTEGAKVLLANVAMRRERDKAREESNALRAEVERLTKERDALKAENAAGLDVAAEHRRHFRERAEKAEADLARLAPLRQAAERYQRAFDRMDAESPKSLNELGRAEGALLLAAREVKP